MKIKRQASALLWCLVAWAHVSRADIIFSDLGSVGTVRYDPIEGWSVDGSAEIGQSYTIANEFTAAGSGSEAVTQIDLAVGNYIPSTTFFATIWTRLNAAGVLVDFPGSEVANAYWNLSTPLNVGTCCGLVSIPGISGVTLTGGQQYFLILGPLLPASASENIWNYNNQGVTGIELTSRDETGDGWSYVNPEQPLGAFDVIGCIPTPIPCINDNMGSGSGGTGGGGAGLGGGGTTVPEPSSLSLSPVMVLIAMMAWRRTRTGDARVANGDQVRWGGDRRDPREIAAEL